MTELKQDELKREILEQLAKEGYIRASAGLGRLSPSIPKAIELTQERLLSELEEFLLEEEDICRKTNAMNQRRLDAQWFIIDRFRQKLKELESGKD